MVQTYKDSTNNLSMVEIYTDGACSGNPGPGGFAAIILHDKNEICISGSESLTTNNRMELMAVIRALENFSQRATINLYTDSRYVQNGIELWIKTWKNNGWISAQKTPVKNEDLWRKLDELNAKHNVTWIWVPAHKGNFFNEKADSLARAALISGMVSSDK